MIRKICYLFLLFFLFFTSQSFALENIIGTTQNQTYSAYNSINDQFLLVWTDCRYSDENPACPYGSKDDGDIYGQIISGNGTCINGNFPIYSESNTVTPESTGEQEPSAVYNPNNNEYLVVWQGHKRPFHKSDVIARQEGYDIFGQRVSANGTLVGGRIKISFLSPNNPVTTCYGDSYSPSPYPNECDDQQWFPRISYSKENHRYIVTWHDGRMRSKNYHTTPGYWEDIKDKTTFKDIYGQILDDDGNLVGNNFPVTLDNSENPDSNYPYILGNTKRIQQYSSIAYDNTRQRFLVVWEDNRNGTGNPHPPLQKYDQLNLDIYGGFFDTNGQNIKVQNNLKNFGVSTDNTKAERYPRIIYNPVFDEYLVVWQSYTIAPWGATGPASNPAYPSDSTRAMGQRLNANGEKIGNPFVIEASAITHSFYMDNSYPPQVGVSLNLTNGQYFINWRKDQFIDYGNWLNPANPVLPATKISLSVPNTKYSYVSFRNNEGSEDYLLTTTLYQNGKYYSVFKTGNTILKNCPSSGGGVITPTLTPQPTNSPTPTLTITPTPICPGVGTPVTTNQFNNWKSEFIKPVPNTSSPSNFNCDNEINLIDFEFWRKEFYQ